MSKTIRCDIVSAHEKIYSGDAAMIFATGAVGELGISPRHAPLITQLRPGPVRVLQPDGKEAFFFDQFVVSASLDDAPILKDEDLVGGLQRL